MNTATLSKPTSSSSATIWATRYVQPLPHVHLAEEGLHVAIRQHRDPRIELARQSGRLAGLRQTSAAGTVNETTSAPGSLRIRDGPLVSPQRPCRLRALDGAHGSRRACRSGISDRQRSRSSASLAFGFFFQRRCRGHHPAVMQ